MSSKDIQEIIRRNKLTIKNDKMYAESNGAVENSVSTIPPKSVISKHIRINPNEYQDPMIEYRDELFVLLHPYIHDDAKLLDIINNSLTDPEVSEFVLHWDEYHPKIQKLEGKAITMSKLVFTLRDMVAKAVHKKYDKIDSTEQRAPQPSSFQPEESKSASSALDVSPIIASWYPNGISKTSDDKIEQVDVLITGIKTIAFGNPKMTTQDMKDKLRDTKTLTANDKQHMEEYNTFLSSLKTRDVYIASILQTMIDKKLNNKQKFADIHNYFNKNRKELKERFEGSNHKNTYTTVPNFHFNNDFYFTENLHHELKSFQGIQLSSMINASDLREKLKWLSRFDLCLLLFYINQEYGKHDMIGTGLKSSKIQTVHKYYVDKQKLNEGILELRYIKNKHLAHVKPVVMSAQMRNVVSQLITVGDVDIKDFELLPPHDKQVVKKLVTLFKLDINLPTDDESFANTFEVLKGELEAGNNSQELKSKIKEYILYAIKTGKISRTHGMQTLNEIGIN